MDLGEGEEPVAIPAIFDERGLQARLYPHHLGEVDIALELFLGRRLDVVILEAATIQNHDAGFLRVRGIDQHTFGHADCNSGKPADGALPARPSLGRVWEWFGGGGPQTQRASTGPSART